MEPTPTTRPPTDARRLWHKLPVRLAVCGAAALGMLALGQLSVMTGFSDSGRHAPELNRETPRRPVPTSTTVPDDSSDTGGVSHFFDDFTENGLPWQNTRPGDATSDPDGTAPDAEVSAPSTTSAPSEWVRMSPTVARVPVALTHPADWTVTETNDPAPAIQVVSPDGSSAGVAVYAVALDGASLKDYAESTRTSIGDRVDGWREWTFEKASVYGRDGFVLSGSGDTDGGALYEQLWFVEVDGEALVIQEQQLSGGDPSMTSLVDELVSSIAIISQA